MRKRFLLLRRIGLGGAEEDLERARQIIRTAAINIVVLLAVGVATVAAGERWAPEWRDTIAGVWVLHALALVAAVCLVWAFGYSVRQQWSARGSYDGMALGMLGFLIAGGLLMLVIHWRFG